MNSKVRVSADPAGNVIVTSKSNPEYGYIRVEQDRMIIDERKTGIVCCVDGEPIYRKAFFTFDLRASDVTVAHTNSEDIKAAYAASSEEVENSSSSLQL